MSRGFLLQCIKQVFCSYSGTPLTHASMRAGARSCSEMFCVNGEELCAFCEPANETRLEGY